MLGIEIQHFATKFNPFLVKIAAWKVSIMIVIIVCMCISTVSYVYMCIGLLLPFVQVLQAFERWTGSGRCFCCLQHC